MIDTPLARRRRQATRRARGARLLAPRAWYRQAYRDGRLRDEHLQAAIDRGEAAAAGGRPCRALLEQGEPDVATRALARRRRASTRGETSSTRCRGAASSPRASASSARPTSTRGRRRSAPIAAAGSTRAGGATRSRDRSPALLMGARRLPRLHGARPARRPPATSRPSRSRPSTCPTASTSVPLEPAPRPERLGLVVRLPRWTARSSRGRRRHRRPPGHPPRLGVDAAQRRPTRRRPALAARGEHLARGRRGRARAHDSTTGCCRRRSSSPASAPSCARCRRASPRRGAPRRRRGRSGRVLHRRPLRGASARARGGGARGADPRLRGLLRLPDRATSRSAPLPARGRSCRGCSRPSLRVTDTASTAGRRA